MEKNILSISPTFPLLFGGLLVLVSQFIDKKKLKAFYIYRLPFGMTVLFLLLSIFLLFFIHLKILDFGSFFDDQIKLSNISFFLNSLYFLIGLFTVICSLESFKNKNFPTYEYLTLFLFSIAGMYYMTTSYDFIVVLIGIELLSIPLYIMINISENNEYSLEASLKYFLLGSFSSGFMLMGIAFIFGSTNSTNIAALGQLSNLGYSTFYLRLGLVFFLLGIFFKIGLFPFHSWKPDVYQGSNTFLTAFMSTAPKIAAIGVLFIICENIPESSLKNFWSYLIAFISILSMFYGNILALRQKILKRLLAYSSIAQAGYMCSAIAIGVREEIFYYFIVYSIMSLATFFLIAYLESYSEDVVTFQSIGALIRTKPLTTICLSILFLSFAGIPPLLGFWAKISLIYGVASLKDELSLIIIFCIALNSAIAVFYYLKVTISSIILTKRGSITQMLHKKSFHFSFILFISLFFLSVAFGWIIFQSSNVYFILNHLK